jgi:hypothetical protein
MSEIQRGKDGYYHPASEAELQALVQDAYENRKQLRVRGSAHSVASAIYASGYDGTGAPPPGPVEVMLDLYRAIGPLVPIDGDPDHATVEVQAGCNLGKNPYDPTGTSTWENSLDLYLQKNGWALDDLGGISHQTVSGFLSTGSSGGSILYGVDDNVEGLRLIDGSGVLHILSRGDELFFAAGVSMGLLGVISTVTLRVRKTFNIYGSQITTSTDTAQIDLFGPGAEGKPSLEAYLRTTPYARLMWWPQAGFERMQVWSAARREPEPGFEPNPYQELGAYPDVASLAGSLLYTLVGNLELVAAVPAKLVYWYAHLNAWIAGKPDVNACAGCQAPTRTHDVKELTDYIAGSLSRSFALHDEAALPQEHLDAAAERLLALGIEAKGIRDVFAAIVTVLVGYALNQTLLSPEAQAAADVLRPLLPYTFRYLLGLFVSDGTLAFQDTWMCGLPMDNQMDDQLWPTWFTELWIPVEKTADVMKALDDFYAARGNDRKSWERTGAFSCEIYAAKQSPFWMSPSYRGDMLRIDVFWFARNAGTPEKDFYPQYWDLLQPFGFCPHWGKFLPTASPDWQRYYRAQIPRLEDFLRLRAQLDPRDVFLSDYWRDNLGIPAPGLPPPT